MFFDLAVKKPLPEAESQPRIEPRLVIVHTMDGTLLGTDNLFRTQSVFESHFGVGGPTDGADLDGVIFQWMDTDRQADANRNANGFAVSIETSDGGDPDRPWSPKQLDALVRLIGALCDHYEIPRQICDRAEGSGLGWHVMFGAPGPWTPVAKTCPGPVRIKQLKDTVFPAVMRQDRSLIPQEVDMTKDELLDALESDRGQRALQAAVTHVLRVAVGPDDGKTPAGVYFEGLRDDVKDVKSKVNQLG